MIKYLMTAPMRVTARVADAVTGKEKVHVDTTYQVRGRSAQRWADEFLRDPSKISPVSVNSRTEGKVAKGQPFPLGPDIGIEVKKRTDGTTADGRARVTLDVQYSGDFSGPGRITVTQNKDGTLDVRDEWNGVTNNSVLPSAMAELGHPVVAGLGFGGIADRARGADASLVAEVGKAMVTTGFKVMTAPFAFLLGGR